MIESVCGIDTLRTPQWNILRSDTYIRDKGICWVCNQVVSLDEYDLGHLIDQCRGGVNNSDNLAVMHHRCNISKPRHTTMQDALNWRDSLFQAPTDIPREIIISVGGHKPNPRTLSHVEYNPYRKTKTTRMRHKPLSTLSIKRQPQVRDGKQYQFIYEHLQELLDRYDSGDRQFMPHYHIDIMLYLAGRFENISHKSFQSIAKRVTELHIPVRSSPNKTRLPNFAAKLLSVFQR